MFTIGEGLRLNAKRLRDKTALVMGDVSLTFFELNARVNQAAHVLASLGVGKGDRVALLLANGLPMAELQLGCAKLGAVAVPVNARLAPPELRFILQDSEPRVLVVEGEILDRLAEGGPEAGALAPQGHLLVAGEGGPKTAPRYETLRDKASPAEPDVTVEGSDPWVIVYTSGTTGRPKGAVRSHQSNVLLALTFASDFAITAEDVGLLLGPMFHVNGIWILSLSLYLGATCVIYPHRTFQPGWVGEEILTRHVTFSVFVPTILGYLAQIAVSGHLEGNRLRVLLCSSAPLTSALRDGILSAFPNANLFELYGSTEAGAVTNIRHTRESPIGTVGYPGLAQEVRILGEDGSPQAVGTVGEIFSRGPTLMDGYFHRPDATAEAVRDGFFSAGDLGRVDEEGRLYLVDRKADMIITMGENVYPTEVEEVIARAPGVHQVAVIGVPDERRGEAVRAFVVAAPAGPAPDPEAIARLCRESLADYKRPRQIDLVPELPVGPTGKVLRRAVRAPFWERQERGI